MMQYLDRETGRLVSEHAAQRGLVHWMYNTRLGRMASPLMLHSRGLHRAVGWLADSHWSRGLLPWFVRTAQIDLRESARELSAFESVNDLFTRRLTHGARPVDSATTSLVSPGDGKLFVIPKLSHNQAMVVKGTTVRLADLLADEALVSRYRDGAAAVLRLNLADYHRLHFPAAGTPGAPRLIDGYYYSVTPLPGNDKCFYCLNVRAVTLFETVHFGTLCLVDVGGFLISSIRTTFVPGAAVDKGDEKGFFAFGGSTQVLLAEAGRLRWDDDLCSTSAAGVETFVKLGTRIGTVATETG